MSLRVGVDQRLEICSTSNLLSAPFRDRDVISRFPAPTTCCHASPTITDSPPRARQMLPSSKVLLVVVFYHSNREDTREELFISGCPVGMWVGDEGGGIVLTVDVRVQPRGQHQSLGRRS